MIDGAEARLGAVSASALRGPATLAYFRGDLEKARVEGEKRVERSRRAGDAYELADALVSLSLVHAATGSPALARQTAEEALEAARSGGVPSALASALILVPWSLLDDDPERALHLFDEAIEVSTRIGDPVSVAMALTGKGVFHAAEGDWDLALDRVRDAIERIDRVGTAAGLIGGALGVAAVAFTALGRFESGAVILGASWHLAPGAYERPEELRTDAKAILIAQLGQSRYDTLVTQGAELSADEAITVLREALGALP
jgi:tetratricopeptide (TPR) repeat protein